MCRCIGHRKIIGTEDPADDKTAINSPIIYKVNYLLEHRKPAWVFYKAHWPHETEKTKENLISFLKNVI